MVMFKGKGVWYKHCEQCEKLFKKQSRGQKKCITCQTNNKTEALRKANETRKQNGTKSFPRYYLRIR